MYVYYILTNEGQTQVTSAEVNHGIVILYCPQNLS